MWALKIKPVSVIQDVSRYLGTDISSFHAIVGHMSGG